MVMEKSQAVFFVLHCKVKKIYIMILNVCMEDFAIFAVLIIALSCKG